MPDELSLELDAIVRHKVGFLPQKKPYTLVKYGFGESCQDVYQNGPEVARNI